jgi:hypothetical protein
MIRSAPVLYQDERSLPKKGGSFENLVEVLFNHKQSDLYAVLDGASDPGFIYNSIVQTGEDTRCLYRGEIDDDLLLSAPHLLRLTKPASVALKLLKAMFDKNAGILARVDKGTDIDQVRRHFRRFLLVQTPEKKTVYFRYYDPRVLRVYLPTCNEAELHVLFGKQVLNYIVPSGEGFGVLVFDPKMSARST